MIDQLSDVTAGRTARRIREQPGSPQPVRDVTDPRSYSPSSGGDPYQRPERVITDPTDPRFGLPRR